MTFEHAFRRYNQQSRDSLAIMISTDCGSTFSYLGSFAEDGTGSFATAITSVNEFVPSPGDWCTGNIGADCFTIDLNAYSGVSGVVIRFESVNNGIAGNNLFIDNINITGDQSSSPPTANFNAQSNVCLGDFIQFTNNSLGGSNYDWSFGDGSSSDIMNPTHEYTSVGTYNVQLTVTNSFGSDNSSQTIVVSAIPTVELSSPFTSVCNTDGGFSLDGSPSGGNYSGPGVNGNVFSPTTAGVGTHTITYTYTDNNGCSASDFLTILVDNCVGLVPNELQSLMLYPNPNKGSFFISGLPESGSISVYSVEGRLISEFEIKEESQSLRLDSPAPGVYRILIRTEFGERVLKMVIS